MNERITGELWPQTVPLWSAICRFTLLKPRYVNPIVGRFTPLFDICHFLPDSRKHHDAWTRGQRHSADTEKRYG